MKNRTFLRVTFAAAFVLLIETVLFHIVNYVHEFFASTAVISYAVLGIGLGAFVAGRIRASSGPLFFIAAIGSAVSIYGTMFLLLNHPNIYLIAAMTSLCVFFPVIYISVEFREHPGGRIYFYDMAGAFLGVLATVLLYVFFSSESIIALILMVLPIVGVLAAVLGAGTSAMRRAVFIAAGVPLIVIGAILFVRQAWFDDYNIYRLFNREAEIAIPNKVIKTKEPDQLQKSYDSLVGRIDIVKNKNKEFFYTCYNGYNNDFFKPKNFNEYDYFKEKKIKYPTSDGRVLYGLVEAPRIFIIGSAARGIINTAKMITPADRITPTEINPAIVKVMTEDFFEQSGRAYEGLKPRIGNAISILKEMKEEFDIITLINTHSGFNIGQRSGPDYLHTAESYEMYFDNLSDQGYLLFEERPHNRHGELGLYRMINTAWKVLEARGVEDPSAHFMIWEWMNSNPKLPKIFDESLGRYKWGQSWYVGMIITKEPLTGAQREKALDWYHQAAYPILRLSYLKDYLEFGEWGDVLHMIERNDFAQLEEEGFDPKPITNDRPFPSMGSSEMPEVTELLTVSLGLFLLLGLGFFALILRGSAHKKRLLFLGSYNMLIGLGYFLIEIMLLEVYVNIFVSASWSLIFVLGTLLISSGIGGLATARMKEWQATTLLIVTSMLAVCAPSVLTATALPPAAIKAICVALIAMAGLSMGFFFPKGLVLAKEWSLSRNVPHFFALNSVAGSFAVILGLYLGIRIGYQSTVFLAVVFYCIAGIMGVHSRQSRA